MKWLHYVQRNIKYIAPHRWRAGTKALYRRLARNGVLFSHGELGMASLHPARKVDRILELAKPQSVLDAGCGTGRTVVYLRDRGIEVLGVEFSRVAIKHSPRPDLIVRHDLRKPVNLGRTFDLVWCFEVAEHIHPKFVDIFVDTLVRHGRLIVLSAAHPGQGGEGHFNEQPQSYWEKRFEDRNYQLHKEWTAAMRAVDEFYSGNMMVFQHGQYS